MRSVASLPAVYALLAALSVGRSASNRRVSAVLLARLLHRIGGLSQSAAVALLDESFAYLAVDELRVVPVAIMQRLPAIPKRYLRRLAEQRTLLQVHQPHQLSTSPGPTEAPRPHSPCHADPLCCVAPVFVQHLPPSLSRQVYDVDADCATDAIDSLVDQLTVAIHQRLYDLPDSDWTVVRAMLDASPILSVISGSTSIFDVALRRLRAAYERTADSCIAELALQLTLQAAAATQDDDDKVWPACKRSSTLHCVAAN